MCRFSEEAAFLFDMSVQTASAIALIRQLFPPLTSSLHKGQLGRIGVLGGSQEYTGAPFFAGMAALRTGADLVTLFCAEEAAVPIKSYSPDLMVHPSIRLHEDAVQASADEIEQKLSHLHALVIGPGMGRHPAMLQTAERVIRSARALNLPVIVDGDGLFLVAQQPDLVRGYERAVLTPNAPEFARLERAVLATGDDDSAHTASDAAVAGEQPRDREESRDSDPYHFGGPVDSTAPEVAQCARLAAALGCVVIQKGANDIVADASGHAFVCRAPGSLKRCGGQGDILAGMAGVFAAWAIMQERPLAQAAFAAACIARRASMYAFLDQDRAMVAQDVLGHIRAAKRGIDVPNAQ